MAAHVSGISLHRRLLLPAGGPVQESGKRRRPQAPPDGAPRRPSHPAPKGGSLASSDRRMRWDD
ncbi:Hypothetical Protein RSKD131_2951 [Cereibacter sphaeroides KD131]|nr:Hypothetical Protein RSKD131_2951 [Cereibacter sphaeroides KD131]